MSTEIATMRRSLAPTTYAEAFEFAQHLAKSSMVPAEYKGKPENILLAMQWGMEVGLAPLQAIQNIAVINGKPSVYGDALLAMVKGSPVCDDVIERFEGSGESLTAICEARRVGKAPVFARFGVAEAKLAHLWGKTGPWAQYPRRMLQMRARGFALRDAFPDVLRGVILAEEATDYPVDVGKPREMLDVTPQADLDRFANDVGMPAPDLPHRAIILDEARSAAARGTAAFREFWKYLEGAERDALRPDIGEYQRVAEAADAIAAAGTDDPFGLPTPPTESTEQPSPDGPAERPGVSAPADSPTRQGEPSPKPAPLLDEGENFVVPLAVRPNDEQLAYFTRQMLVLIGERPLDGRRAAMVKQANERGIGFLKLRSVEAYDTIMAALHQTVAS